MRRTRYLIRYFAFLFLLPQYLNTATPFVTSLFATIRQQRHLGIRTVISTQEPTVIPDDMLGLCSTVICHRFSSPAWWKHLKRLITLDEGDASHDWFDVIAELRTGRAVVFCPLALGVRQVGDKPEVRRFGRGCMVIKTRQRLTGDAGQSVLSQRVN